MHSIEKGIYLRYKVKSVLEMEWFICSIYNNVGPRYEISLIQKNDAGAQKQENYGFLCGNHIHRWMLIISIVGFFSCLNCRLVWTWDSSQTKQLSASHKLSAKAKCFCPGLCVCVYLDDLIVWIALVWNHAGVLAHTWDLSYDACDLLRQPIQLSSGRKSPLLGQFSACYCFI